MKTDLPNSPQVILLIEDEESLQRSITFTLLRQGHCIISFGSVDDAFQFMADVRQVDQKIQLIISDLQLPGKNGIELVNRVRADYPHIPILIITGHGSREVREELERLGVKDILDKPFDIGELVTKVQAILAGKAKVP